MHYFGLEGRSHTANPRARLSIETFMWVRKSYAESTVYIQYIYMQYCAAALVPPALQCAVATATAAAAAASLGHSCIWEHVYLQSETKAAREISRLDGARSLGGAPIPSAAREIRTVARARVRRHSCRCRE
uniref:Uncharacterized protein n=1 Tax=Trichogramma kaykai TaxID=54128 RepID=A0ABD2X1I4_9HYME